MGGGKEQEKEKVQMGITLMACRSPPPFTHCALPLRNKNQCRSWVGFSVKMAHRITAGVDILLMPSRFEPCGLNQVREKCG